MRQVRWRTPGRLPGASLLPVVAMGGTLVVTRLALPPAQPALVALTYAAAGIFALLLFCPNPMAMRAVFGWSATLALLVTLLALADPATRTLVAALPALATTLLLLCATLLTLRRKVPAPLLFAALALLTALPVAGAPWLELAGNPPRLTDAIVAASPLTAIAVALEFDYLRSPWFYANSALGSLRYDYPGWLAGCLLLACLPVAALLREAFAGPSRFHPADEANKDENKTSLVPGPAVSAMPARAAGGGTGPRTEGERATRGRRRLALPAHQPGG